MNDEYDEKLAAWIDGAMSAAEAAAFEQEMAADPELARKAAAWKANDAFIMGALAPLADAPLDPDLLARMGLAEPAPAPIPQAANDNPPFWRRHALPLGGAIAASLVAALLLVQPRGGAGDAGFTVALDTTPSLQVAKLADGRTIEPTLTVRAADGRWCREYRSADQSALACRDAQGWKVEATTGRTGPADQASGTTLAGGGDSSGLDAAYRKLGAGDPVGAQDEAQLIKQGWR